MDRVQRLEGLCSQLAVRASLDWEHFLPSALHRVVMSYAIVRAGVVDLVGLKGWRNAPCSSLVLTNHGEFKFPAWVSVPPATGKGKDCLWVTDHDRGRVFPISRKTGRLVEGFGRVGGEKCGPEEIFSAPRCVRVNIDGILAVVDGTRECIKIFDPTVRGREDYAKEVACCGNIQWGGLGPKLTNIYGCAWGMEGELYGGMRATDTKASVVAVFRQETKCHFVFEKYIGKEWINDVRGVAVDRRGRLLVADCRGHCILLFHPKTEELLKTYSIKGNTSFYPMGLAVDGAGRIFAADWQGHKIHVFEEDGTYWGAFGDKGIQGVSSTVRHFQYPWDVAIDEDGVVYVADSDNHRVVVWNRME